MPRGCINLWGSTRAATGTLGAANINRGFGPWLIQNASNARRANASLYQSTSANSHDDCSPGGSVRILLVEDHRDSGEMLKHLLQLLGYEVVLAESMSSATSAARHERFDVVISDLGLPDGSGYVLLETLRTESSAMLPAIALSGYGMTDDRERSRAAGFQDHLVKPVDVQDLEQAIERAIRSPESRPAEF